MKKVLLFDTTQKLPPNEQAQIAGPLSHLKIFFQPADDAACGNYRCIFPAAALREKGAKVKWSYRVSQTDLFEYDIFIFQRPVSLEIVKNIKQIKSIGKIAIVELDDNLHNVPHTSPVYSHYKPNAVKALTEVIKEAHGLIVSTPELAEYYYSLNKNISVCYNSIDFSTGYRDWTGNVKGIDLSSNPDDFVLSFRGGICYAKDTKVLTEKGFVYFKDLKPTTKLASLDPATNTINYVVPKQLIKTTYSGTFYRDSYSGTRYTDNHNVYSVDKVTGVGAFTPAKQLVNKRFFVQTCSTPISNKRKTPYKYEFFYTLGVMLSQGSFKKDIVFLPKMKLESDKQYLKEQLDKLNIKYVEVNYVLGFSTELFKQWIKDISLKQLPADLSNLSTEESIELLSGVFSIRDQEFFYLSSDIYKTYIMPTITAENLLVKGINAGLNISIDNRKEGNSVLHVSNYGIESTRMFDVGNVEDDEVYCAEVDSHIICVLTNGRPIWSGNSHMEDIKLLKPHLEPLMNTYPNLHFSLYSSIEFSKQVAMTLGVHKFPKRVHIIRPRSFIEYPQGLAGPDAYVVPLTPSHKLFNDCKSELALAEVGAVGCPAIASDCAPYNRFADNHKYALTVSPGEFTKGISYMIDNREYTKKLGEAAYYRSITDYNLDTNVWLWATAIKSIKEALKNG
jgi:glycosyltransferase involved in cell wall biosynthesis